jgi:hypothetical protein
MKDIIEKAIKIFDSSKVQKFVNPDEFLKIPDSDIPRWEQKDSNYKVLDIPDEFLKIPDSDIPRWEQNNSDIHPWEIKPEQNELKTRNENLEGKKHPETGVPYERKQIKDANGEQDEGVFPVFEKVFEVQLPEELLQASDAAQEKECNKQLKDAVDKDLDLAKKFTTEQLEQIKNGDTPEGYTWHHNEETGKMQLVDSEIHAKTGHTGGKVIWGGGQENR